MNAFTSQEEIAHARRMLSSFRWERGFRTRSTRRTPSAMLVTTKRISSLMGTRLSRRYTAFRTRKTIADDWKPRNRAMLAKPRC